MIALLLGRILFLFAAASGCAWLWIDGSSSLFLSPRNAVLLPWTGVFLWLLGIAELVALRQGARKERFGARHPAWLAPFVLFPLIDHAGLSARWASGRALASVARTDFFRVSLPEPDADSTDVLFDTLEPLSHAPDPGDSPVASSAPSPKASMVAKSCKALLPVPVVRRRSDGWCALPVSPGSPCIDTLGDGNWFERFRTIETLPQKHRGRWIKVTGFVIPADPGERWSFLLSRMLVWCCAADASPIGFRVVPAPGGARMVRDRRFRLQRPFADRGTLGARPRVREHPGGRSSPAAERISVQLLRRFSVSSPRIFPASSAPRRMDRFRQA